MRPIHSSSSFSFVLAVVLTAGAFVACSSNVTNPKDGGGGSGGSGGGGAGGHGGTGGTGGGTGGTGGGTGGTGGGTGGATDGGGDAHDGATDAPADVHADAQTFDVAATDGMASINVTSTALTEGGAFPSANTCAGVNTSPPLAWTAGPGGTMSYAVTLTDLSINAVHWVVWDLPMTTRALPANLPGDTTLTTPVTGQQLHRAAFFGAGGAYRGPCPSGANHTYQFEVNAIPTATLAGVTATTTTDQIRTLIQAASLAHGDLSGTSNATAPPADAGGN